MHPSPSAEPLKPLEFAIFNNGVPSSIFYGEHPEHDVVQHIPDEAIEELFPPSADEAAEIEAAEAFVETMAWLSYLDEEDEAARFSFAGIKKRWEARREDGLVGKPHPAKSRHYHDDERSVSVTSAGSSESSLIPFTPRVFEAKPRKSRTHANGSVPRNSCKGQMHQPRRQYCDRRLRQ